MDVVAHEFVDPAFTIRVTPAHGLVELALRGFWDGDTVERFDRQYRAMLALLPAVGQHQLFSDLTDYAVQNPQTLEAMAAIASDAHIAPRRSAVLVPSALLKRQAMRTIPDYTLFADRDAAIAWLTAPDPASAPQG